MMFLGVVFVMFVCVEVVVEGCYTSWICRYIAINKLGNSLAIIFQIYFLLPCLVFYSNSNTCVLGHLMWANMDDMLIFKNLFSFCITITSFVNTSSILFISDTVVFISIQLVWLFSISSISQFNIINFPISLFNVFISVIRACIPLPTISDNCVSSGSV